MFTGASFIIGYPYDNSICLNASGLIDISRWVITTYVDWWSTRCKISKPKSKTSILGSNKIALTFV